MAIAIITDRCFDAGLTVLQKLILMPKELNSVANSLADIPTTQLLNKSTLNPTCFLLNFKFLTKKYVH
jgi:hypothetical protein